MTQLTNQLLAYARGGKYQPKVIAIDQFITDNISIIKHSSPSDCEFTLQLRCGDEKIMADSTQLQMLFSAVFANAVEAIEKAGKITLQTAIKNFTEQPTEKYPGIEPGQYIFVRISDNGCGMDPQTVERIFEPFFTTKFHGRGLGMASAYGIVKNHNGYIFIDSSPGNGSSVNIFLPVHFQKTAVDIPPKSASKPCSGTILIVEDEELVTNVIISILQNLEYDFIAAKTAEEAQDIVKSYAGDIDIIILDMGLPDMPGDALFPILKKSIPRAKTVICSGYSIDGPARQLLRQGADAFLQKPFSVDSLKVILADIMK